MNWVRFCTNLKLWNKVYKGLNGLKGCFLKKYVAEDGLEWGLADPDPAAETL